MCSKECNSIKQYLSKITYLNVICCHGDIIFNFNSIQTIWSCCLTTCELSIHVFTVLFPAAQLVNIRHE